MARSRSLLETSLSMFNAEKYLSEFRKYNIDVTSLGSLTENDLKIIGINDENLRKQMVNQFSTLPRETEEANGLLVNEDYMKCLINEMEQHIQILHACLSVCLTRKDIQFSDVKLYKATECLVHCADSFEKELLRFHRQYLLLLGLIAGVLGEAPLAPYAPSGWKPQGQAFTLPARQVQQEYGPPPQQSLPEPEEPKPWQEYGLPSETNNENSPSVEPSINWQLPTEYGAPPSLNPGSEDALIPNDEATQDEDNLEPTAEDEETLRVLQQIRQYRKNVQRAQRLRSSRNQQLRQRNFRKSARLQTRPRNARVSVRAQRLQQRRINRNRFSKLRLGRLTDGTEEEIQQEVTPQDEVQVPEQDVQSFDGEGYAPRRQPETGYEPGREYGVPFLTTTQNPLALTTEFFDGPLDPINPDATDFPEIVTEASLEDSDNETTDDDADQPNIAVSTATALGQQGQYYVLQRNGKLQRVTYRTSSNPRSRSSPFVSNLRYETVRPIKDPIYSFVSGRLVRINK